MNDNVAQLIGTFTTLPPDERHAVIVELARISEDDAGSLSDDDLIAAGNEIFCMYDREEAADDNSETR